MTFTRKTALPFILYSLSVFLICITLTGCKKGPSEQELLQQAEMYQEQSDFTAAVTAYKQFVEHYPEAEKAPQCQFMVGYLYANHLDSVAAAQQAYRDFIRMYPEHELIKDAQWELDHLGMDVNEIEELNEALGAGEDTVKIDTSE